MDCFKKCSYVLNYLFVREPQQCAETSNSGGSEVVSSNFKGDFLRGNPLN